MIESPATQSTTLHEATPDQTGSTSSYMTLNGDTNSSVVLLDIERSVEVGGLNTVVEANLYLFKSDSWGAGTHTLTIEAIDAAWDASVATYNNQPAVRATSVVVVVPADGAEGDEIEVDITSLLLDSVSENDADGSQWFGVKLSVDTAGDKGFFSAYADPDFRPFIAVEPAYAPDAPDNLAPADGNAASETTPIFEADFSDDEAEDYITALQFQLDTAEDFTTPDYDSGEVTHDQPIFDSASPPTGSAAFTPLTPGTTYYWRMRVADRHSLWSDWSDVAEFTVVEKGTLVLASPSLAAPTFDRESVAYNPEDFSQVAADAPRYVTGKYGDAILIEEGTTNLLTSNQSQDFTDVAWTKTRCTISSDVATAPDGTMTADKLVEDTTATASHLVHRSGVLTVGQPATISVYAKAGERTWMALSTALNLPSVSKASFFNLATGAIGTRGTSHVDVEIEDIGDGWYRCSVSDLSISSTSADDIAVGLASADNTPAYTGDGASGIYIWHPQAELKSHVTNWQVGGTARAAETLTVPGNVFSGSEQTVEMWVKP